MELARRTIERYVPLKDDVWEAIAPLWHVRSFRKGEIISRAGTVENWLYIVDRGVQKLYFGHDGNEHCLGFSYDHSWSGDFDSFISRRPGRFDVQAVTDSVLLGIQHDDLHAMYDRSTVMERFGRLMIEELIHGRATREIELLTFTAEERYRKLLSRSPHLLQLVPQKDIASYLRMTPETFSRLRAKG